MASFKRTLVFLLKPYINPSYNISFVSWISVLLSNLSPGLSQDILCRSSLHLMCSHILLHRFILRLPIILWHILVVNYFFNIFYLFFPIFPYLDFYLSLCYNYVNYVYILLFLERIDYVKF